jgi:hypothetical protein
MRTAMGATGRTTMARGSAAVPIRSYTGLTVIFNKGVCRTCNTGWLADLERRVKEWIAPALVGQSLTLTPVAQRAVAAWAVEKALLLELVMRKWRKPMYAPASNLRWLYAHRADPEPPPGSQVWLAAVDAQLGTTDSLTAWNKVAQAGEDPVDPEFYFVTFSAGYLVVQVAGQDFSEPDHLSRSGQPLRTFLRPQKLLSHIRSIWPARDERLQWPPLYQIRRNDLPRFGEWEGTVASRYIRYADLR